jgi:hypothetical protein
MAIMVSVGIVVVVRIEVDFYVSGWVEFFIGFLVKFIF